ncbi:tRNA (adenosine(37)-N6)-threonylcarbamoyltransferase complex ATPase subunit type 1 TsaE [Blochmannia endosymbiont of Camponotus (Colobopsis) obliquus]|uniref:tRNA (adenosine(37)-N6)-threonylcarbamoyltransferase complex ATPase subunit type 1 TsaE n=1 Tax=Blochmannia endosymbiont of Camponotus (Colobopsis) obliquus TaxID=1505597 RepID=UPI00061A60AD|nr:tRNA (adenosine(37)-N6)-threonylcarbamoyltransferase complex ATPase subunit type 1 TsaE [Blochmannia endosymbiont of Camponotus (Colobopsis) obliquus]AKC60256.1 ATP-binding protein YjeE [Blochmannia endosymbiont of Camponotus (Colobopsis) obliquus]
MKKHIFFSSCDELTIKLGMIVGSLCFSGCLIYLNGHIGSGKTTFCRGLLYALGYVGVVKSPTYTLIELYEIKCWIVYHFDLYRIKNIKELEYMAVRDYFNGNAICLVEWASHGVGFLPVSDIVVTFYYLNSGRQIILESSSINGGKILTKLLSL